MSFPVVQPAYQPGNVIGNFLPAWFKATSSPVGTDWQVGDVVVHTNDRFNGNPALGNANVLFTTPVAGKYDITASLWNADVALVPSDFAPRPQDWELFINGVMQGPLHVLPGLPGNVSRANPQTYSISNITLNVGDTVELDVFKDPAAQAGFFVGTDLTIQPTRPPVPEPTSLSLLTAALAGLGLARRKHAQSVPRP